MTDLTQQLTVFVITVDEPSFQKCLAALQQQTCKFQLKTIEGVTPMWRAFQRMLDECQTPFYVQVDADMILHPDTIENLYRSITAQGDRVAEYVMWLWDEDVKMSIQGIKIYRHTATSQFPYQDSISCEMVQVHQLKDAGYTISVQQRPAKRDQCAGDHLASQTPEMAFRRWQRLLQKHRSLPWMDWVKDHTVPLMNQWRDDPTPINQAKFLGSVAGLVGPAPDDREMDFSRPNDDFRRITSYFGGYAQGPREVTLYLTSRCNFKCVFNGNPCLRQTNGFDSNKGDMSFDMMDKVLNRWPTIKGCCIAGFGEPLLHPAFDFFVGRLKKRCLTVGIITNGSLLADKVGLLAKHKPAYVSVSLNAATPQRHREITQTKMWAQVLHGIQEAVKAGIRVGISAVITRHSVHDMKPFLKLGQELGVKFIHLHNILPHDGSDSPTFRGSVITDQSEEALKAIADAHQCPGSELVEVWPQPIGDINPLRCQSPFVSLGFDASGCVSGCRRVRPPARENGLATTLSWENSPYYMNLRLSLTGDRPLTDACKGCFGNWRG